MPTGHAVAQSPQAGAGLDAVVVVERRHLGRALGLARRRPRGRAISRQPTMRWRGESVSPRDGHFGSQKPHSMHLSMSGSAAGSGFRSLQVRDAGRR